MTSVALAAALVAQPPPARADTEQPGAELETVTVTAQRRSERIESVPITINHLSAEQLTQAGVTNLTDVATLSPALRFDRRAAFVQPTIRGVGTPLGVNGGTSNVGLYIDGYYSSNPLSLNMQLLNIENIQVLKGPQGTLFGRNTSGGAILVNTTKPSTNFSAMGEVSYDSYNAQRYQAYVTSGLTDNVAFDVAGLFSQGDGFTRNIFTGDDEAGGYENSSIRTGLAVDISENASLLLRYEHQNVDDRRPVAANAFLIDGLPATSAAFRPGAIVATKRGEVSYDDPVMFESEADIFQLTGTFELPFATLTSYSQYRDENSRMQFTNDYSSLPILTIGVPVTDETTTQEFLLTSRPGGRLQWTAGAFYYDYTDGYLATAVSVAGGPFGLTSIAATTTKSNAAYADLTYSLRDNLFLTGGARYTRDETDAFFVKPTVGERTDLPTLESNEVTPRVVIRYEPNARSSIYASYSRGYKGALYNPGGFSTVPLAPEKLSAFEVGYKYGSPVFSAALSSYYYDYQDQQLSSTVAINGIPVPVATNAASSHMYGAEAQASYRFVDNFEINAGAAWMYAKYRSFPGAPTLTPCFDVSCGAARGALLAGSTDASGFHMARSPEVTGTVSARYSTPLAHGELALSGSLYYASKFYFDTSQQFAQDAYTLLQLRAEWTSPSQRFSFAIYGNNVTDEEYLESVFPSGGAAGAIWGAPATVGAWARFAL